MSQGLCYSLLPKSIISKHEDKNHGDLKSLPQAVSCCCRLRMWNHLAFCLQTISCTRSEIFTKASSFPPLKARLGLRADSETCCLCFSSAYLKESGCPTAVGVRWGGPAFCRILYSKNMPRVDAAALLPVIILFPICLRLDVRMLFLVHKVRFFVSTIYYLFFFRQQR